MDVTIALETHSEHIARSKQAGVTQSDSKFKCPFVLGVAMQSWEDIVNSKKSEEHPAKPYYG